MLDKSLEYLVRAESCFTFYIFDHISVSSVRMRKVSDKFVEKIKTNFRSKYFFNRAVYHIMRRNVVEPVRPQMTIWRVLITCWITKSATTHSNYVILNDLPLQQSSNESSSKLRYTYIASLFV
jgi:hypothetical protein